MIFPANIRSFLPLHVIDSTGIIKGHLETIAIHNNNINQYM